MDLSIYDTYDPFLRLKELWDNNNELALFQEIINKYHLNKDFWVIRCDKCNSFHLKTGATDFYIENVHLFIDHYLVFYMYKVAYIWKDILPPPPSGEVTGECKDELNTFHSLEKMAMDVSMSRPYYEHNELLFKTEMIAFCAHKLCRDYYAESMIQWHEQHIEKNKNLRERFKKHALEGPINAPETKTNNTKRR